MDLNEIANAPGFGTGKKARDRLNAKAERRNHVPPRNQMNEIEVVTQQPDVLVASFGNDPDDGKDYSIGAVLAYSAIEDIGTAGSEARALAALWNAYRDGDLVWKDTPND